MKLFKIELACICFGWMSVQNALGGVPLQHEKPWLMISVGDSMTAGFIAQTSAVPKKPKEEKVKLANPYSWILDPVRTDTVDDRPVRKRKAGFFYEVAQLENHKSFSWSSGTEIQSHYKKLLHNLKENHPSASLEVQNFAVTGARTLDLPTQTAAIMKAWKTGKFKGIKYVTVLIGANDACNIEFLGGTPAWMMERELGVFFQKMASIQQDEPMHILVSALPKIPVLAEPEFFDFKPDHRTCRDIQLKELQFCVPLLNWKTYAQFDERMKIVEDKNAALKRAVERAAQRYEPSSKILGLKIYFATSFFDAHFKLQDLAADCFHPNESGQAELADLLWREQPWFR